MRLANYLIGLKTLKNRGLPPTLKNIRLRVQKTTYRRKGDVLLQIWKTNKKRDVRIISTIDIVDTGEIDRRTGLPIKKPKCIVDYNNFMSGVDLADQYLSYNPIYRKSLKWTKKASLYLINCGIFNAFQMF